MANTFLSPTTVTQTALEILRRQIVLPRTVSMDASASFAGAIGDTINIRKPGTLTARTYTDTLRNAGTPIVLDDVTETSVPLKLDTHLYSAVPVTDEQLTLNIVDFGRQVLLPQTIAVAEAGEDVLVAKMNALASSVTASATGSDIFTKILDLRRILNQRKVPLAGRTLAVSAEVEQLILNDAQNRLVKYEASGDTPNDALREATIGRLYGFEVVSSIALAAGTAIAYQADAFAMAMRAPAVPDGANFGQSIADNGMAMRWLRDYDAAFVRDRSIVSTLAGAVTVDANRAVKLTANGA